MRDAIDARDCRAATCDPRFACDDDVAKSQRWIDAAGDSHPDQKRDIESLQQLRDRVGSVLESVAAGHHDNRLAGDRADVTSPPADANHAIDLRAPQKRRQLFA